MAYTEQFKVLKIVHETKIAVKEARGGAGLTPDQNALLEKLYIDLEKLEDDLILGAIDEHIEALKKTGKKLEKITKKIDEEIQALARIAELVGRAAKAIKLLVDIVSTSSSLGLV